MLAQVSIPDDQNNEMVQEVESRTRSIYPRELIIQAINMAPECKLE